MNNFIQMTLRFLILLMSCSLPASGCGDDSLILNEKPMVVVITSYNNIQWYKRNLDSILSQHYHNFRVIYVDDASPDGTGAAVAEYLQTRDPEHRVTLIQNQERGGCLANHYLANHLCDKNEIIVDVDGDDWLAHEGVLAYLNEVYADPNIWMTYGQYITYPFHQLGIAAQVPQDIIDQNSCRMNGGYITHLRTFYAGLFHRISKEDLLFQGKFLPLAADTAYMVPVFEMGGKHSKFISEVLYVYNRSNPINEDKVNRQFQHELDLYIRNKPKYLPLDQL